MAQVIGKVNDVLDSILSYERISKIIPISLQQNTIIMGILKFFLALFNQRNIFTLPLNFMINFAPVFIWLMFFKNAGFLSKKWRSDNIPIHNGVTKVWDHDWFEFNMYGFTFCCINILLVFGWWKGVQAIQRWHTKRHEKELTDVADMYAYHTKSSDTISSTTTTDPSLEDIESQRVQQEKRPQYYLDVKRGPINNQLNLNGSTSAFDSDIEMFDMQLDVDHPNVSTNQKNVKVDHEANNRNLNAIFDSDIEDDIDTFGDNTIHNVTTHIKSGKITNTLTTSDSNAVEPDDIVYNPKLNPKINTQVVTITKSLKDLFSNVTPWVTQSDLPQLNSLIMILIFTIVAWMTLNIDQYFARPITGFKDIIAFLHYVPGHAVAPITTAIYLYIFQPAGACAGFSYALGIQNILGVWTHLFLPSTPPWFHEIHPFDKPTYDTLGYSAGLHRIMKNWGRVNAGFNDNKIVFGAAPSLHSAIAVQTLFFVLYYCRNRIARGIALTYVVVQWWATIYLSHHWRFDLIVGMWYSLLAFAAVLPYLLYVETRYKKIRYVDCDSTAPHFRTFGMRLLANSRYESFFDPYYDANVTPLVQQEIANSNRINNNNNNNTDNQQQQQQNVGSISAPSFDDIVDEFAVVADSNQSNNNQNITTNTRPSAKRNKRLVNDEADA